MVDTDDLQKLRLDVLKRNPLARSDVVLARKLFRKELRDSGAEYENSALDICHDYLVRCERRIDEPPTGRPNPPSPPTPRVDPPVPQKPPAEKDKDFRNGYERAKQGIASMRFANGRDILNQTVDDIQKQGTWAGAILKALPKSAKLTDKIGQHLSLDQLTKIRTFEV